MKLAEPAQETHSSPQKSQKKLLSQIVSKILRMGTCFSAGETSRAET